MIHIKETYIDRNFDCTYGDSEVYETYTDSIGELFKDLQIQFGRCVSSMYMDKKDFWSKGRCQKHPEKNYNLIK